MRMLCCIMGIERIDTNRTEEIRARGWMKIRDVIHSDMMETGLQREEAQDRRTSIMKT